MNGDGGDDDSGNTAVTAEVEMWYIHDYDVSDGGGTGNMDIMVVA